MFFQLHHWTETENRKMIGPMTKKLKSKNLKAQNYSSMCIFTLNQRFKPHMAERRVPSKPSYSILTENERFDEHDSPAGDSEGLAEAAEAAGQDGSAEQVARPTGKPFWSPFRSIALKLVHLGAYKLMHLCT